MKRRVTVKEDSLRGETSPPTTKLGFWPALYLVSVIDESDREESRM